MTTGKQLLIDFSKDVGQPLATAAHMTSAINRRPLFNPLRHVAPMIRDSRVEMALWFLKGTLLSLSRFWVRDGYSADESNHSPVKQFVVDQINRWWQTSVQKQLSAIEWGWAGHETYYRFQQNQYHFSHLKLLPESRPVTVDGRLVGLVTHSTSTNKQTYIGIPKSLWHVQGRQYNELFGRSRLHPAFEPWLEKNSEGGAMDVRRLYFYKFSFQGDIIYYPTGSTPNKQGMMIPNEETAAKIVEKQRAGASIAFPSVYDENGNRLWTIEHREGGHASADVLQYPEVLKADISEGIGVPRELLEASETGSGWSGRRIPQDAFRGMLSDPLFWLIHDFDEQCIRPLVRLNFAIDEPDYEIIPFGLVRDENNQSEAVNLPGNEPVPDQIADHAEDNLAA
jgi:hypothetical protein